MVRGSLARIESELTPTCLRNCGGISRFVICHPVLARSLVDTCASQETRCKRHMRS